MPPAAIGGLATFAVAVLPPSALWRFPRPATTPRPSHDVVSEDRSHAERSFRKSNRTTDDGHPHNLTHRKIRGVVSFTAPLPQAHKQRCFLICRARHRAHFNLRWRGATGLLIVTLLCPYVGWPRTCLLARGWSCSRARPLAKLWLWWCRPSQVPRRSNRQIPRAAPTLAAIYACVRHANRRVRRHLGHGRGRCAHQRGTPALSRPARSSSASTASQTWFNPRWLATQHPNDTEACSMMPLKPDANLTPPFLQGVILHFIQSHWLLTRWRCTLSPRTHP